MSVLSIAAGIYLTFGLYITFIVLKDDLFSDKLVELDFISKIFVLMVCIISGPVLMVKGIYEILKK